MKDLTAISERLEDEEIVLRRYRLTDAPALVEAARESIPDIFPWMPWCHPGYSAAEADHWAAQCVISWDERKSFEFVIERRDGLYLGGCGINQISAIYPLANLGYWVRSSQAGKGYAARAARLAAKFGLGELGLQRVEVVVAAGNMRSMRVAEKSGARREGVLRNRLSVSGIAVDAVMHSFTGEDLEE